MRHTLATVEMQTLGGRKFTVWLYDNGEAFASLAGCKASGKVVVNIPVVADELVDPGYIWLDLLPDVPSPQFKLTAHSMFSIFDTDFRNWVLHHAGGFKAEDGEKLGTSLELCAGAVCTGNRRLLNAILMTEAL